MLSQCLQVTCVPELTRVTTMWLDVIDNVTFDVLACMLWTLTVWLMLEV